MGKLEDLRALGRRGGIAGQYVQSGGTIATPAEIAALRLSMETRAKRSVKLPSTKARFNRKEYMRKYMAKRRG
jgi:hypothetical protein